MGRNVSDRALSTTYEGDPSNGWAANLDDPGLPRSGVECFRAVAGADAAAAYLVDPDTQELRLAEAAGAAIGTYGLPAVCALSGRSPLADAVRSNRPLWLDAARVSSYGEAGGSASLGVVPLTTVPAAAGGAAPGCLVAVWDDRAGPVPDRRTLLELYADHVSTYLDVDGGEPTAHGALRDHRLPWGRIGTFTLDRGTGRIDADATLLGLFDVDPGTFDGHVESLIAHTLLDDLPTFMSVVGRSGATSEVRDLLFRARRASGEPRWLHLRCRVRVDDRGRPGTVLGVVADVMPRGATRAEVAEVEELTAALAVAATVQDVGRIVVDSLRTRLNADRLAFAVLRGDLLAVTALDPPTPGTWPRTWRPDGRTEWLELSLSASPALEAVLGEGRTTVWPAGGAREPGLEGVGPGGLAVLPLSAEGRVVGACLAGWDAPHRITAQERSRLSVTAGRAAQALARAQAIDTERELVRALQTSLLPRELPELSGAAAVARYLPGTAGLDMGGDWYDVIISNDQLALVIGDVQGHSAEAATIMGQVSTAVRAYAAEGHPPDVVLARANRLLVGMKTDLFATCCYVSVNVEEGIAWFVRAGHPSPLLRRPDGTTEEVEVAGGPPLGVVEDADYPITVVDVAPGSVLALMTDGLVASAGPAEEGGLRRVRDVLGAADVSDVGRVADELISGADRHDDVALLLLRYDGTGLRPVRASWRAWRLPDAVMHARRFTARTVRSWGVTEEADVIQLIVSELVTNAVVHTQGDVLLDLTLSGDRLRIAVTDSLPRAPVKPRIVDWESTGGRGIMLVEAMSTAWGSVPVGGGKQVWSEIALPEGAVPGRGRGPGEAPPAGADGPGARGHGRADPGGEASP